MYHHLHLATGDMKHSLCDQCQSLNLSKTLHYQLPPYSGATLVATRTGLDPRCSLCNLFSTTIFPGTYNQPPSLNSNSPWELRSLNMHFASVPSQISQRFPGLQVCVLHAGDGERDYYKHINDEEMERRGYLAYARTRELVELMASGGGGYMFGIPQAFVNVGEITIFTTASFVEQDRWSLTSLFARLKQALNLHGISSSDECYGMGKVPRDVRSGNFALEPVMV